MMYQLFLIIILIFHTLKMSVKQIDGYKIRMNECLGKGAYGTVYIGESDKTHKKVAIKVIQKNASIYASYSSRL